jgi:CBS domain-containing protein
MQVMDAIRKQPQFIAPDATIARAAELMDEAAVGALAVVDDERLVGIVTDRDIVVRGLARRVSPDGRIDSVMTPAPTTIDADAELRKALLVFRDNPFRRLPVVDGTSFVGMLTVDDLLIDVTADLWDLVRPVTGQVIFGHGEPAMPVELR